MSRRQLFQRRDGNIAVLSVFMIMLLIGVSAFAIDLGHLSVSKAELQRAADSAAIAACSSYVTQVATGTTSGTAMTSARQTASTFSNANKVYNEETSVDLNSANDSSGDIVFGTWNFADPNGSVAPGTGAATNAVQIRLQRTSSRNGEIPFYFARLMGTEKKALNVEATAAVVTWIKGFGTPSSGSLGMLPFALRDTAWQAVMNNSTTDTWRYNESGGTVSSGSDGKYETNLFPNATGAAGNSGTVDIGNPNNSTNDLKRQIEQGISAEDLAWMGGKVELGSDGTLILEGDTGISAGMKASLESIIGKPRIIPIFSQVTGVGNNARFTIVKFVGVRILEVKLTGNPKRVMIQPANVVLDGVVPGNSATSDFIFTPVILVK
jgi:Flp pilus assembly protein TadG